MEQHPVPQHIASYEFRLIGDMTIKQFGQLSIGALVALFFYSTHLPSFLRWPLVLGSCFTGFAFAFMPIEERPLSQWLAAFFKSIFSPTIFTWQKGKLEIDILRPSGAKPTLGQIAPALPIDRRQLTEYLRTLPLTSAKSPLEQQEEDYLKRMNFLFQTIQPKGGIIAPIFPTPSKPITIHKKPVRIRKTVVEAKVSQALPIPHPPTQPNILVGMVLDKNGEMIEGAILEIRNSQDMPVRALKTNKLGQFQIVTPLENDIYEIEVEKENYQFDIIKIEAKGEIIPPIEIRAKGAN